MELIFNDAPGSIPAQYVLPPNLAFTLESATAVWNGAGASGPFLACLSAYSQDGHLIGRWFPGQSFATGDSGEVSYGPFGGGADSGALTLAAIDNIAFEPVGGFLNIPSTNPNAPTTVVTASPLTFDGVTTIRIEFFAAGIDIDQRGIANSGAALLEIYEDGTAIGISGDFNASAGIYYETVCYVSTFVTPAAGTHTYSLRAYGQGGGGGAVGSINIYGSGLSTPHATRAGFLLITEVAIS